MKVTEFIKGELIKEALDEHLEYWQEQFGGELGDCGVPLDYSRPAEFPGPREHVLCEVPKEIYSRINLICAHNESLMFTLLVAALKVCLRLCSGQDDIRIGTTIRRCDEPIAAFNKVLVLRENVSGDLSFQQLTSKVKETLAEAYKHQISPFKELV